MYWRFSDDLELHRGRWKSVALFVFVTSSGALHRACDHTQRSLDLIHLSEDSIPEYTTFPHEDIKRGRKYSIYYYLALDLRRAAVDLGLHLVSAESRLHPVSFKTLACLTLSLRNFI